ncbi:B12-binding domain-containing radical SAM protein [Elusimicrobiota bacterium]
MKNIIMFQPDLGYMDSMRTSPSLPLALLSASALVSKYYKVNIVDQRITPHWKGILEKRINKDTVCAGVTALTGRMIKEAVEFSRFVKNRYGIPVVWGGVHASILPYQTAGSEFVDFVVAGEGEITFYELVKALDEGRPAESVRGLFYKKDGSVIQTLVRPFAELDELPAVPYHLVDIKKYLPKYKGRRSIFFQTSRGCPWGCTYCYNTVYNKRCWRSMSAGVTLSRIRSLVSAYPDIEDIYFVDDNFFIDVKRLKKIIRGLTELDLTWQVQGVDIMSLKCIDDEVFGLLQESNCIRLTIGIESGSQRIREFMHKKGNIDDILKVMDRLSRFDFVVLCSFLVGIPGETRYDLKKTVDLILKLKKINSKFRNQPIYVYTPYPGTDMYKHALKHGFVGPVTLEDWSAYEWDNTKFPHYRKIYESIHFVSLFTDKKINEYTVPFLIRLFANLYRPFALYRLKNLYFGFMLEKKLFELVKNAWLAGRLYYDENTSC